MNEKINAVQKHVRRNRAKYAAAATLTACVYVQYKGAKQWNQFLKDEHLFEKFYEFNEV